MALVDTREDINHNLLLFRRYLNDSSEDCLEFARSLIKSGRCFIASRDAGGLLFTPSKFAGYKLNDHVIYTQTTEQRDGRDSNAAINRVLGFEPLESGALEKSFQHFAGAIGVEPGRHLRRFWELNGRVV